MVAMPATGWAALVNEVEIADASGIFYFPNRRCAGATRS